MYEYLECPYNKVYKKKKEMNNAYKTSANLGNDNA